MADSSNRGEENVAVTEQFQTPAAASTGGGSGSENDSSDDDNSSDSSDDELLAYFLLTCASYIFTRPQREISWVEKLLDGSETEFYNTLRMSKPCFKALVDDLIARGRLTSSPQAQLSLDEKVAIFLRTVGHQDGHLQHRECFQHSTETVNRAINQVLKALMRLAHLYVALPDYANTSPQVVNDPRFYPYLKDVVGVMDGSLIPTWVPDENQRRFRLQKGILSQNVLAICDLNGLFTYVYAGWEGNATDKRVTSDVILNDSYFPWPPEGKMYLVDDDICNSESFLAPYKSTRYHLHELQDTGVHPSTPHELFNLRHSQLRSVVQKSFGMLKSRFPVLRNGMPCYSIPTQVKMVIACCAIHNFIRRSGMTDPIFDENRDGDNVDPTLHSILRNATRQTVDDQSERKDSIADAMWQNRGVE